MFQTCPPEALTSEDARLPSHLPCKGTSFQAPWPTISLCPTEKDDCRDKKLAHTLFPLPLLAQLSPTPRHADRGSLRRPSGHPGSSRLLLCVFYLLGVLLNVKNTLFCVKICCIFRVIILKLKCDCWPWPGSSVG